MDPDLSDPPELSYSLNKYGGAVILDYRYTDIRRSVYFQWIQF